MTLRRWRDLLSRLWHPSNAAGTIVVLCWMSMSVRLVQLYNALFPFVDIVDGMIMDVSYVYPINAPNLIVWMLGGMVILVKFLHTTNIPFFTVWMLGGMLTFVNFFTSLKREWSDGGDVVGNLLRITVVCVVSDSGSAVAIDCYIIFLSFTFSYSCKVVVHVVSDCGSSNNQN